MENTFYAFQRFIAIIGDAIEKHGHVSEDALKGTVEMNKHEQWLVGTMERLQEVFLRHEKVFFRDFEIFVSKK